MTAPPDMPPRGTSPRATPGPVPADVHPPGSLPRTAPDAWPAEGALPARTGPAGRPREAPSGEGPLPPPQPAAPLASEAARKALHVLAATAGALVVWRLPPVAARGIVLGAACLALAIDLGRLLLPAPGRTFARAVGALLRAPEHRRLTGATMLAIGSAAAVFLFPARAAIAGVLYAGVADAVGAVAGRAFGRHRYGRGKSLEGSLAFLGAAFLIGWTVPPLAPATAALVALALAALEALPLPIDDNLSVPLAGAALVFLLSAAP